MSYNYFISQSQYIYVYIFLAASLFVACIKCNLFITKLNESGLNESELNESDLNESDLNESELNESDLNESELNDETENQNHNTNTIEPSNNKYEICSDKESSDDEDDAPSYSEIFYCTKTPV